MRSRAVDRSGMRMGEGCEGARVAAVSVLGGDLAAAFDLDSAFFSFN